MIKALEKNNWKLRRKKCQKLLKVYKNKRVLIVRQRVKRKEKNSGIERACVRKALFGGFFLTVIFKLYLFTKGKGETMIF